MPPTFQTDEKHLSQLPAVELLLALGYEFLDAQAFKRERKGRSSEVILEEILREQLSKINSIHHKGESYAFSEANIHEAITKLKNIKYEGLRRTNEQVYDLLTLGTALEERVAGDRRSFTLKYIDWAAPQRNRFHVAVEYKVARSKSNSHVKPDIVLFVNGIPFCVIECKAPAVELQQAVSQMLRNQGEEYIPRLFGYTQLVLALNKNSASYATTGTPAQFWAQWKEETLDAEGAEFSRLHTLVNQPVSAVLYQKITRALACSTPQPACVSRQVTEQDKYLYALCRPERLLEIAYGFNVFDHGQRKIARYQQYFVIKSALQRVKHRRSRKARQGGIIWHTQGSGKSLTMVMLARNLALDAEIMHPRIVLVTDRDDLDKQLGNTFQACGLSAQRAKSGKDLVHLISSNKHAIITSLIHKFERAYNSTRFCDESDNIFILVDESHRTQFGNFSAAMRLMFPHACYLGFTGTPLLKKEKNSFKKFGGLVTPYYSIRQAVEDGAVVPLLYEGRHVEMFQNQQAVDLWFERHTDGLTKEQKADLKRKYARAEMLNKAEQVIYMRAFDISEHFRAHWKDSGFKAQLVAPNKVTALKYKEFLDDIGMVSSELIISPPDTREGSDDVDEEPQDKVIVFWRKMMNHYGNEASYTEAIINRFKNAGSPEILIVVDKLLTGFDAPRNTVLYLCRKLKEHTLLQAIARVNRLFEGKDFGYIVDYVSVLGELDEALSMYSALEGYDEADIYGSLLPIQHEIDKLPEAYSRLCDIFKTIEQKDDEEEYERLLADEELRIDFHQALTRFSKLFKIALSSEAYLRKASNDELSRYKGDLKRFTALKKAVQLRYDETIDFREYEPKIKKLFDTHIQANEVIQLNEPVNIFDDEDFSEIKEERGISTAAKADRIAHRTKKVITEKMEEDPAFYKQFSILIQEAIDDFRARRLSDLDYLKKVTDIQEKVVKKQRQNVPPQLEANDEALAYYGVLRSALEQSPQHNNIGADIALKIQRILETQHKVDFWDDEDAQNRVIDEIEDYFYDELQDKHGISLSTEQMDTIIHSVLQVAKHRS